MRWLPVPCLFVLGCGFSAPKAGDSDAGVDGSMPDTLGMPDGMPDVMPDTPPPPTVRTRLIDITDAQVAGGPHTDFPLLVSLTQDWLRPLGMGGDVRNASGFDIGFFADAAGTTRLAHEVEQYTASTGTLVAWVKVPSLAAASQLYIRYGDPAITSSQENRTGVWSANFAAVWHLNNALGDSTANNNMGNNNGSLGATGQIANGRSFDGMNDSMDVGTGATIDDVFTGGGTVEAWFNAANWGQNNLGRIVEKGDTGGWLLTLDNSNTTGSLTFYHGAIGLDGHWIAPANSVMLNTWTHVAVVYNQGAAGNKPLLYINGASATVTERVSPGGAPHSDALFIAHIGNNGSSTRTFEGVIDEVRMAKTTRSADWITTSHNNQKSPAAFYSVGPEL